MPEIIKLPPGPEREELKFGFADTQEQPQHAPSKAELLSDEYRGVLADLLKSKRLLRNLLDSGLERKLVDLVFIQGKTIEEANEKLKFGSTENAKELYREVLKKIKLYLRLKTDPSFLHQAGLTEFERIIVEEVIIKGKPFTSLAETNLGGNKIPKNRKHIFGHDNIFRIMDKLEVLMGEE